MSKVISEGFLNQEKRRGFTISELMKRSWMTDIQILNELLEICKKHNIHMFACYGTLLGTVREHGFIPWDDDIDIGMVGADYVRFLDVLASEYSDRFNILNPYTRTWYNMNFSHITNNRETSFKREYLEKWNGCPFMTGPDVYPYYYIPRNPDEEQFILNVLEKIDAVIAMNKQSLIYTEDNGCFDSESRLNEMIATALVELQHITDYRFSDERPLDNQLEILYDQVCRITEECDADYVVRYDEYTKDRSKKFPKAYFKTTIELPFESVTMPVPIGYDAILRARFGDCYIIPKREVAAHGYPYFSKQLNEEEYRQACLGQKELPMNDSIENPIDTLSGVIDKKRILYHTGFKSMLTHCEAVTNKIKVVLGYAEKYREAIELWWMPDELLKTDNWALDLVAPSLIKEYEELISGYMSSGGHLCSMRINVSNIAEIFDEYFGDEGEIAEIFRKTGKLVTIQDYNTTIVELDRDYKTNNHSKPTEECKDVKTITPYSWKHKLYYKDGRRKKSILYINSLSVMFQNGNSYLNKIRDVLKMFKEYADDMVLIWIPCKIDEMMCDSFDERFIQEYETIVDEHRECRWLILEESDNLDIAIGNADAYYGDPNDALLQCKDRGLPVMIQN